MANKENTERMCPWCFEVILGETTVCEHCGRDVGNTNTDTIDSKPSSRVLPFADAEVVSGPQVRPWVRLFARMLDLYMFGFLAGIFLELFYPEAYRMNKLTFVFFYVIAYCFFEPIIFALWGTTFGKALLKIHITDKDNNKLSYSAALSRTFNAVGRGLAMGIPVVNIVALIIAYNKLKKQGITSWDRDANIIVTHQNIETWRIVVAAVMFMLFFYSAFAA